MNVSRFHTTQYDLNEYFCFFLVTFFFRFHTTQYDLNLRLFLGLFVPIFSFPYYIVRFKHDILPLGGTRVSKFPYYIVRFKLGDFLRYILHHICFHTTQYDLNSGGSCYVLSPLYSFHTTQYDLNPFFSANTRLQ